MKITIAGTGYVGLVTGAVLAHIGHDVTCIDTDKKKIDLMKKGVTPIYEPKLSKLLTDSKDRITFTVNEDLAYGDAEAIFIAVGTPEKPDGSADLKYVYEVSKQIALKAKKDLIVVIKSTVPIGASDAIKDFILKNVNEGINITVASNPEFLSQGSAVDDMLNSSRIVIGAKSKDTLNKVKEIFAPLNRPFVLTDTRSAEMIKYASNNFLALKISFINEIANLCEALGADIDDVARGMGLDSRIGEKFLKAGIGYGGSCFPKDTKALHWLSNCYGYEIKTIKAAIKINEKQKLKLIEKAHRYYDSLNGLTVAILGLTFKPGTDDLREAPSLANVPKLLEEGAHIRAYDPVAIDKFKRIYPQVDYFKSIEETLKGADICFIFTEWPEIKNMDTGLFESTMKKPIVLDGRNCLGINRGENAGFIYDPIGKPAFNKV